MLTASFRVRLFPSGTAFQKAALRTSFPNSGEGSAIPRSQVVAARICVCHAPVGRPRRRRPMWQRRPSSLTGRPRFPTLGPSSRAPTKTHPSEYPGLRRRRCRDRSYAAESAANRCVNDPRGRLMSSTTDSYGCSSRPDSREARSLREMAECAAAARSPCQPWSDPVCSPP